MLEWLLALPTWKLAILIFTGLAALVIVVSGLLSVWLEDFS